MNFTFVCIKYSVVYTWKCAKPSRKIFCFSKSFDNRKPWKIHWIFYVHKSIVYQNNNNNNTQKKLHTALINYRQYLIYYHNLKKAKKISCHNFYSNNIHIRTPLTSITLIVPCSTDPHNKLISSLSSSSVYTMFV